MAWGQTKISELPALVGSGATALDVVPIVDVSAGTTGSKKMTLGELFSTPVPWQGAVVAGQYGGTGVNNSGKSITLGGNLTTSGSNALTLTTSGPTNVTLPTSGTLATQAELGGKANNNTRVAAVVVNKTGVKTEYTASADSDAARGIALTTAILAMNSGETLVCAPGDYYMATTNLLLVDSGTYIWNGARLYINGSSSGRSGGEASLSIALFTSGFAVAPLNVSNWKFIGPLTLDGGNVGNRRGLWPIGTTGALVDRVTFRNWGTSASGMGFLAFNSVGKGNRMANCYFDSCAGTGAEFNAEYWAVSNCHAFSCGYGFVESGGNTSFANCSATFCTYGVRIMNGSNPGHGSWIGGNVNHSTTGIYSDPNITAAYGGFSFMGVIAHSTAFDLNGKGITWVGGEIANTSFGSSGANAGISQFYNVRCLSTSTAEGTSLSGLSNAERANIKFRDCRDELGVLVAWNDEAGQAYVGKSANYTLTGADRTVNVSANSPTITLPTAINCAGRQYIIANTGGGTVTVATTSSQTIDGSAPGTVSTGARLRVESNGANWITW